MNLLGKMDADMNETERKEIGWKGEEEKLGEEEIGKAVMIMMQKKAVGTDEIPMETWRRSGKKRFNGGNEECVEWKTSIIVPPVL